MLRKLNCARSFTWLGLVAMLLGLCLATPVNAQDTKASKLKVTVPQDDAILKIMGKEMKQTGTVRTFNLPKVDTSKEWEYDFVVEWRPNNYTILTRKKTVVFKANADVEVDLTIEDPNDKAVIRYVPTPDDIVAEMIKLADIKKDDVVFEPGCGDCRITIAAVKAGAKKGVGVDLDPDRIQESNNNIKAAKLDGKIEARLGDALDIKDFDEATVVFLYMGDEFNMLIRPVLWKQLKVGTRIVSHRFIMGDWKPEKTITITGEDGDEYELHLWTITDEVKKKAK